MTMIQIGSKDERFYKHSPPRRSRSNPTRFPNLDSGKLQGNVSPNIRPRGVLEWPSSRFHGPSPLGDLDSGDLRIGLPMINDNAFGMRTGEDDKKKRLPNRAKSFMPTSRTMAYDETPRIFNPDPVPFHSQLFNGSSTAPKDNIRKLYGSDPLNKVRVVGKPLPKQDGLDDTKSSFLKERSSTMIRKYPIPKRHGDMWGSNSSYERSSRTRGIPLQTDRLQWDDFFAGVEHLSQPERMALEAEYMDRLRSVRRQRQVIPHRETLSFTMGGNKVELNERDDIMAEIRHLKSVSLPTKAKDLYVGRGFRLPENHALNKPKKMVKHSVSNKAPISKPPAADVPAPPVNTPGAPKDGSWTKQMTPSSPDHTHVDPSYIEGIPDNGPESEMDVHVPLEAPAATENPSPKLSCPKLLKNIGHESLLEDERNTLKATFAEVTSGEQSNLKYEDIESHLPAMSAAQTSYVKQVFQLVTEEASLDEEDFISLQYLCKNIAKLEGAVKNAIDAIDASDVPSGIQEYVDQFLLVDRQETGKISMDSLYQILQLQLQTDNTEDVFNEIKPLLDSDSTGSVTKLDYITHIPYFISLKAT